MEVEIDGWAEAWDVCLDVAYRLPRWVEDWGRYLPPAAREAHMGLPLLCRLAGQAEQAVVAARGKSPKATVDRLVDACEAALILEDIDDGHPEVVARLRAAIAAARGEAPGQDR